METAGNGRSEEEMAGASMDEEESDDEDECCLCMRCPPQLFTSVLLGILACVLVTGGVFLAFHKWDHTWLLVSAIGVVLMAIGTALHCCSSQSSRKKSSSGHRCKGNCGGRSKMDSVNGGGGMLTEQLLPLSNARSVSQLSLNMVPGYFPPLVYPSGAPYGIEQHSAVVQNISRLVQHQQQLHLQSPNSVDGAKSFILLPLPSDANATNIQNIMAAVCQLDSNNISSESNRDAQTTDVSSQATESSFLSAANVVIQNSTVQATSQSAATQLAFRHVEVQTCDVWNSNCSNSSDNKTVTATITEVATTSPSIATSNFSCQVIDIPVESQTQTEEDIPQPIQETVSNGDCSNLICDTNEETNSEEQSDIPVQVVPLEGEPPDVGLPPYTNDVASVNQDASLPSSDDSSFIEQSLAVLDVDSPEDQVNGDLTIGQDIVQDDNVQTGELLTGQVSIEEAVNIVTPEESISDTLDIILIGGNNESDSGSISEDSDLLESSSPPPSYDDVTQGVPRPHSNPIGSFGLAYGTM